ncbi:MAG: hypothetical protein ACFE0I_09915 [Elainellaceae cyanobacterium]
MAPRIWHHTKTIFVDRPVAGLTLTLVAAAGILAMDTVSAAAQTAASAILVTDSPAQPIDFRTLPISSAVTAAQGQSGDRIEILDQSAGRDRYIWYYVIVSDSNAGGWVREDLISFDPASSRSPTSTTVPNAAREACKNYGFVQLDTFRPDIEITNAQVRPDGNYQLAWQQQSTDETGVCIVNSNNQVLSFGDERLLTETFDPTSPQETLHEFRIDNYLVRIFQQGEQYYTTLFNTTTQNFELENTQTEQVTVDQVNVYLASAENRDYQIRVEPTSEYRLIISEGNRQVYP